MATTLKQDLIKLRKLKAEATALDQKAKDKKKERDMWLRRCFDRMDNEDIESLKTAENNFVRSSTEYGTVQDRDVFVAWAKENEPELIAEKEEVGLLNGLVRARLADNQELPPGVGFYTKDNISIRKA